MSDLEQAARQALEALECHADIGIKADKQIAALRQALEQAEQPKQEPMAYSCTSRITGTQTFSLHPKPPHFDSYSWDIKPLYIEPPRREWVGLTDEEIESISEDIERSDFFDCVVPFAHAIEAKLKEKNT